MPDAKDFGNRRYAVLPRMGGPLAQGPIFFWADAITVEHGVLQCWGHDPGSKAIGNRLLMAFGVGEWVTAAEDTGTDRPVCLEDHRVDLVKEFDPLLTKH